MPLETKDGQKVEVEFVSNVYQVDHHQVAQCNIRDITERSRLERQMQEQAEALADLHRRKDEFLAMLSPRTPQPPCPHPQRRASPSSSQQPESTAGIENPVLQQAATIIERQVGQLTRSRG